jgi:hypothetical protein
MTAPKPEAPTLDACISDAQIEVDNIKDDDQLDTEWGQMATLRLASLERLRAIENANGMPEEPERFGPDIAGEMGAWVDGEYIYYSNYDALRLHAQHLQDRLNRMEALMAGLLDTYASVLSPQMCAEIDAALLAKVEGRG